MAVFGSVSGTKATLCYSVDKAVVMTQARQGITSRTLPMTAAKPKRQMSNDFDARLKSDARIILRSLQAAERKFIVVR